MSRRVSVLAGIGGTALSAAAARGGYAALTRRPPGGRVLGENATTGASGSPSSRARLPRWLRPPSPR